MSDTGGGAADTKQSTSDMMSQYMGYLPQVIQTENSQLTPTALAQLQAAEATTGRSNQLNFDQLKQFGLPTAQINQQIAASNAQAGAQSNLNLLKGTGGDIARAGQALNEQLNPNYYRNVQNATDATGNLLKAINLNGLSPGEFNSTERAMNQGNQGSGNLGLSNNTNTISNAQNFGGAFNQKLGLLNNAIGTANNTANTASGNAGYNPVAAALGTSQTAQGSPFNSTNFGSGASGSVQSAASNILSPMSSITAGNLNNVFKSNYTNSVQGVAGTFAGGNGMSGGTAGVCCFVALEGLNGSLPPWVRLCRDLLYMQQFSLCIGYKRTARSLVPLMMKFKVINYMVNVVMVKPFIKYGGYLSNIPKHRNGWIFYPIIKLWLLLWNFIGRINI